MKGWLIRRSTREFVGIQRPWWLGFAWYEPACDVVVLMPIPVNWFVGGFRAFWLGLQRPCEPDPVLDAYHAGVERGRHEAYRCSLVDALDFWLKARAQEPGAELRASTEAK